MDLYSALDDKCLVLKALRHGGSHSLTCNITMPAFSLHLHSPECYVCVIVYVVLRF